MGRVGLVALLALGTVACTDDDGDRGAGTATPTTTPPVVSTPPRPDVVAQLDDPTVPLVDLPAPPFDGHIAVVAGDGSDVVAFGGTASGMRVQGAELADEVAVLGAATASWTELPPPPFDAPTYRPVGVVKDGDLVVSGSSCTGDRPMTPAGPDCMPTGLQAARLHLADRTWERIGPPHASGSPQIVAGMWSTPTGVLAMVAGVMGVPSNGALWSFLPDGDDTWQRVGEPPIPLVMACGSGGTVAGAAVETSPDGVTWTPAGNLMSVQSDRHRHVRAVFWDDPTRAWGTPTEPASERPLDLMGGACFAGRFVWVAMVDTERDRFEPLDPADQGLYSVSAGREAWERLPFSPPDGVAPLRVLQQPLPSLEDPPSLVLTDFLRPAAIIDIDANTSTPWPSSDGDPYDLTSIRFHDRYILLARTTDELKAIDLRR